MFEISEEIVWVQLSDAIDALIFDLLTHWVRNYQKLMIEIQCV